MRRKAQGGRPGRGGQRRGGGRALFCWGGGGPAGGAHTGPAKPAGRFIAEARVKRSRKTTGAPEEPPRKSKKERLFLKFGRI